MHTFWNTQPSGRALEETREPQKDPLRLPDAFEWVNPDIPVIKELLDGHYVEGDDTNFRFKYTEEMLTHILSEPAWILGVRVKETQKLVACITAIPLTLSVHGQEEKWSAVDFLCIHKKLRSRRLAPVLIKEITRRINTRGVWKAVYTGANNLPNPLLTARYWHRSLNTKKLIDIGFLGVPRNTTASTLMKLNRKPPPSPYMRPMVAQDVPRVRELLNAHLARWPIHRQWSLEEVSQEILPLAPWVNRGPEVTDFVSFYTVPTSTKHPLHPEFKNAHLYYCVPGSMEMKDLVNHAMAVSNADVFTALDVMDREPSMLKDMKFKVGTGLLKYYLFNSGARADTIGLLLF